MTIAVLLTAALAVGGGGFIQVISTNRVSGTNSDHRWEPASSASSTWVTSWNDLDVLRGYTSVWGGPWETPFRHTLNGQETGDLYLTSNNAAGPHYLTMLGLSSSLPLGFRKSTDSTGRTWNPTVVAYPSADYPSVAVGSNGTIVIAFNRTDGFYVYGQRTIVSTNGGQTWSQPTEVTNSGYQAFGRVVAVGNTFHLFLPDRTGYPTTVLKRYESSNGVSWTGPFVLDTYTDPQPYSRVAFGNNGRLHYATNIDAAGSTGLGWVVLYAVTRADDPTTNNLKFCTAGLGCVTITYATDLFLHGITTSASGDLWFSMFTYSGSPNRTLPLNQIAAYRTPGGVYYTAFINTGINPTAWRFDAQGMGGRCGTLPCYSAGDYMRPAMNIYSGGSLPLVRESARTTDLMQTFVLDPDAGLPPVPDLKFSGNEPFGMDSRVSVPLSSDQVRERQPNLSVSAGFLRDLAQKQR